MPKTQKTQDTRPKPKTLINFKFFKFIHRLLYKNTPNILLNSFSQKLTSLIKMQEKVVVFHDFLPNYNTFASI